MENEAQGLSSRSDLLSESYCEGVERVVGTQKDLVTSFQIPTRVLQEREKFWNDFFDKYSEELSDDTQLDLRTVEPKPASPEEEHSPNLRMPMRKPASLVQQWINTGTYIILPENNERAINGQSLSEQELLKPSVHLNVVKETNVYNRKSTHSESSSCSSVDTAAYILSNANVTKKAETIAIVEGARYSKKMGSQQSKLVDAEPPTNTVSEKTGDNVLDNNDHNRNDDTETDLPKQPDSAVQGTVLDNVQEKNVADVDEAMHETIMTPDSNERNNNNNVQLPTEKLTLHESIEKALRCLTNNSMLTPSHSEGGSGASMSPHDDVFAMGRRLTYDGEARHHRKKLYSGRDSPVDLAHMRCSLGSRPNQPKKVLHPALEPITPKWKMSPLKKRMLHAKKRKKWSLLFAKKLASHDSCQSSKSSVSMDGSRDDQKSNELAQPLRKVREEELNDSVSVDNSEVNADLSSSISTQSLQRYTSQRKRYRKKKIYEAPKKYKHNKKLIRSKKFKIKPVTFLDTFPDLNLKPVVVLERLSDSTLQRHKNNKPVLNSGNTNPVVCLPRLTDCDIQKYTTRNPENGVPATPSRATRSFQRSAAVVGSTKAQSDTKLSRNSVLSENVQNIDLEDAGSDQSTLLICRCQSNVMTDPSVESDNCSVTDGASRNVVMVENCDSSAKHLKKMQENAAQNKSSSSDTSEKIKSKCHTNYNNASAETVDKLRGSGNFAALESLKHRQPVVVLEPLPDRDIHDLINRKKPSERHVALKEVQRKNGVLNENEEILVSDKFDNSSGKYHRSGRSSRYTSMSESTASTRSRVPPVFKTTFMTLNDSEFSDGSEFTPSRRSSRLLVNNKRNVHPKITFFSSDDEDDFVKLIEKLPNQKSKSNADCEPTTPNGNSAYKTRLLNSMEVLSDTTDDASVRRNNRKTVEIRRNTTSSKTLPNGTNSGITGGRFSVSRRSKRIEASFCKSALIDDKRRSHRLISARDFQKRYNENGTKEAYGCSEPSSEEVDIEDALSMGNVSNKSNQFVAIIEEGVGDDMPVRRIDPSVSLPETNRGDQARISPTRTSPRRTSPRRAQSGPASRVNEDIDLKQRKTHSWRFQTRSFDDSDSECLSMASSRSRAK